MNDRLPQANARSWAVCTSRYGELPIVEVRAEWPEPEVERRGDPEVPTSATQAPEELGLVCLGCAYKVAVGGYDLNGGQVVDRQLVRALEPANATAEGQSSDPGVTHDP